MIRPVERKVVVPALPEKGGLSVLHQAVVRMAEAHNHHDDMINGALRGGTSASNNSLLKFLELTVQMPAEAPWQAFTPQHSFANQAGYVVAAYVIVPGGQAWMRGVVKGGASTGIIYSNTDLAPVLTSGALLSFAAGLDGAAELRIDNFGVISAVFTGTPKVTLAHTWLLASGAAPTTFGAPWPIVVKHGFSQCAGLSVDACQELSQNAKGAAPLPMPAWQDVGNGQLRLDGLWGLQWGKKYNVRLRMTAES